MYTYIEQMWRLSASERAELKVKHGHTSRFARHTDERAVCYSEAILVYGGVKVNIAQQHSISSGEPSRVACPTRWRRLLPANEFHGIRAHEFHDATPATLPEEKRGAWNSRRAK